MIEFGLPGDVDVTSLADESLGDSTSLQDWLWNHRNEIVDLEIRYEHDKQSSVIYAKDGEEVPIALLGESCARDLWGIAKIVAEREKIGKLKPGGVIRHIRMVGVTTVVVPEIDRERLEPPWRHSGFLLAPVITGYPTVYFNRFAK